MKARLLVAAALALGMAACAKASPSSHPGTNPGRLVVVEQLAPGAHLYVEGSIGFVSVTQGGATVFDGRLVWDGKNWSLAHDLAPGSYRLSTWQRPCDGNCGKLGAPTDGCVADFELVARQLLQASLVLRPSEGCSISFPQS